VHIHQRYGKQYGVGGSLTFMVILKGHKKSKYQVLDTKRVR
jgi:hypothetical protein